MKSVSSLSLMSLPALQMKFSLCLMMADLSFGKVTNEDAIDVELTHGNYNPVYGVGNRGG